MIENSHTEFDTGAPRRRRWSIRWRVLSGITVAAFLSLGLFFTLWLPRVTNIIVDTQLREVDRQLEIIGDAILPFILQNQLGATHETLNTVIERHTDWKSIELTRPDGRRLYPISAPPVGFEGEIIVSQHNIEFENNAVAHLKASVDIGPTLSALRKEEWRLVWILSAGLLLAAGILAYVLDAFIGRRLSVLATASERLAKGDFEAELPDDKGDEIGALASSFAVMRRVVRRNDTSLRNAKNEAERAARVKTQFLATMSHEIRTPINGIIPVADLLLENGDLNAAQRQKLDTIRASGRALLAVIDDILDVTKLEAGRLELRQEQFELRPLVDSVLDMLRVQATLNGIELRSRVSSNLPTTYIGDPIRLRQVLINLVGNAIKFTEEGYVSVEVRLRSDVKRRHSIVPLEFKVTDTGIGISEENHAKVFQRFSQVESTLSRRYTGTGLGLSISKALIEAMEGEIGLDSVPGEGSTFWFTVDLTKANISKFPAAKNSNAQVKTIDVDPLRILVAEDNVINQEVLRTLLETAGHDVTIVGNGVEVVEAVAALDFDILIVDVQMPKMSGLDATRKVREMTAPKSNVKIVGLSASAFEDDRQACLDAGMDDFMSKPVSKPELFEMLTKQCAPNKTDNVKN